MKLYLYCVLADGEALPASIDGVLAAPLTVMQFGSLYVVTSEFDGDVVPVSRNHVLKHSSVINSVLERTTPLPFRFGTIVDETTLVNFIESRKKAIVSRLSLLQGFVEMSVKIIWDFSSNGGESQKENTQVPTPSRGTAFLEEKRREYVISDSRKLEAEKLAAELKARISSLAGESEINLRPNEKLVLAGSHLVERRSVLFYREALIEFGQERPDLRFLVSGPWAPYSFANIDLEFKTHFGVS